MTFRRPHRCALVSLAALMLAPWCVCICRAQEPDRGPLPLAGPPPAADELPPMPEEARRGAAMQMLLAVMVGLAAVVVLLRFISKDRVKQAPEPTLEQELVDRVQEALERMDSAGTRDVEPEAGEGTGEMR